MPEMAGQAKAGSGRKRAVGSLEEDAFVSLQRTADLLARKGEKVLRTADISPTQYNVLRILRGSPQGLPCREIANRMITRDPDITRLLDRLERRGLIARSRETKDRRVVMARVTAGGLHLLAGLDAPVLEMHRKQLGHLGRERLRVLMEVLAAARQKAG
jgi:DNA-binding MarR family transcriptional regulator